MLHLHRKRAHTLVVVARNVQALWSEVELLFRHGFRGVYHLLFNGADLPVHHGGHGWRSLWRTRDRGAVYALSQRSHGQNRSEERRVGKECRSRWAEDH